MAGKKEPITGISHDPDNKLTVQKSNPMSALWQSKLTLAEFKILDAYLARINSHNPSDRSVRYEKGEIEALLGVKKINMSDLKKRVSHLMKPLMLNDGPSGFRGLALFEEAVCRADENGVWQVDLECTQKAKKYFFNIENLGYYRYKLRCVAGLKSRYSYILFNYLERNRFRKSWEVPVAELKQVLNCDDDGLYKEFKYFNERILNRVQKELTDKTELRYTYEPVKKGRTVVAVRFTLETLKDIEPKDVNQFVIDGWQDTAAQNDRDEICLGFSDPAFSAFSDDELRALKELAWHHANPDAIERHKEVLHDTLTAIEYAVSEYLAQQIMIAKVRKPKNLYLYVKKMVENEKLKE